MGLQVGPCTGTTRRDQRKRQPLRIGRWQFNKQEDLLTRLALGEAGQVDPCTRFWKIYIGAFPGFSHMYCSDGLNNTLLSQGCILEKQLPLWEQWAERTLQGWRWGAEVSDSPGSSSWVNQGSHPLHDLVQYPPLAIFDWSLFVYIVVLFFLVLFLLFLNIKSTPICRLSRDEPFSHYTRLLITSLLLITRLFRIWRVQG